jgi:hypothetical protein
MKVASFFGKALLSIAEKFKVNACKINASCFGKMNFIELPTSVINSIDFAEQKAQHHDKL